MYFAPQLHSFLMNYQVGSYPTIYITIWYLICCFVTIWFCTIFAYKIEICVYPKQSNKAKIRAIGWRKTAGLIVRAKSHLSYISSWKDSRVAECDIVKVTSGAARLFYYNYKKVVPWRNPSKFACPAPDRRITLTVGRVKYQNGKSIFDKSLEHGSFVPLFLILLIAF